MKALLLVVAVVALAGLVTWVGGPMGRIATAVALVHAEEGHPDKVLRWAAHADRAQGPTADVEGLRAGARLALGDSAGALAAYDAALALPHPQRTLYALRAALVLDLGADTTGLAAHLAKTRRLRSPRAHRTRADYERLAGHPDRALAALDMALRWAPEWAPVHAERGDLLVALGRDSLAERAFQRAARAAPYEPWPQVRLTAFYALRGRWAEAAGANRAATRLAPHDPLHALDAAGIRYCLADSAGVRGAVRRYRALGGADAALFDELRAYLDGDGALADGCDAIEPRRPETEAGTAAPTPPA